MEQAVKTAQIHEGTIVGDVLDDTVDDLTLGQGGQQFVASFLAAFFENGPAGDNDVATTAIHFQDLEGLLLVQQVTDIAHRADIDLRSGQEGNSAAKIHGKTALDLAEDVSLDPLGGLNAVSSLFQLSSRRALSRERTASPLLFSKRST